MVISWHGRKDKFLGTKAFLYPKNKKKNSEKKWSEENFQKNTKKK